MKSFKPNDKRFIWKTASHACGIKIKYRIISKKEALSYSKRLPKPGYEIRLGHRLFLVNYAGQFEIHNLR